MQKEIENKLDKVNIKGDYIGNSQYNIIYGKDLELEQLYVKHYEEIRFGNSEKEIKGEEKQDLKYIIERLAAKHIITIEFLAHLALTKDWTVKELRENLEQRGFHLEYKDKEDELINVQKCYEILYNLSEVNEAEQNILEAFCLFPHLPLSIEICNQWLLSDAGVEEEDILIGLERKGWLKFNTEQKSYTLYDIFAQFLYEKFKPKWRNHSGLIKGCQKNLELPESGSAFECQKFIPFAENIIEKIDKGTEKKQVEFIFRLAYLLQYIGAYKKAEKLYQMALTFCRDILGENHSYTATSYRNLGVIYYLQKEYKKAEELYEKSLKIQKDLLGENHEDTATGYSDLASIYHVQKEYQKAEEFYEKSLKIREGLLEENHQNIIITRNNLAMLYSDQGEYKKAKELYEKSLEIQKKKLGENHLHTASSYHDLAILYTKENEYKKAEEFYEKSLRIYKSVLGENHPETVNNYYNLALLYHNQKEYKKAEEFYKRSLKVRKEVLGENHLDIVNSYYSLASLYVEQREYEKAEELYEKGLKIQESVLGENHLDIAKSCNSLAITYYYQEKYKKAEEFYERSLKIRKSLLGESHLDTATSYNNLAIIYHCKKEY